MPTNGEAAFGEDLGEAPIASVYDFLYSDSARIASLLAQFDPQGHLTAAKIVDALVDEKGEKAGGSIGGGLAGLFKARAYQEGTMGLRASEGAERTYDPYWANARELLNLVEDRLVRDIRQARIGQLVLVTGDLAIADLAIFKNIWSTPAVKEAMAAGAASADNVPEPINRAAKRKQNSNRSPDKKKAGDVDTMIQLITNLPHLVRASMATDDGNLLWATLAEGGMVGSTSDLLLRHGALVSGKWTVMGVLDAQPEVQDGEVVAGSVESIVLGNSLVGGPFGEMIGSMVVPVRQTFGRPFHSYGVTPLMIFREVG